MKTLQIEIQIEKLTVLKYLIDAVKIDNDDLTRDMLLKLKEHIDSLLESDF